MSFNPLSWIRELFQIRKLKQDIDAAKEKKRKEESGIVTDVSAEDIEKYDPKLRKLQYTVYRDILSVIPTRIWISLAIIVVVLLVIIALLILIFK